VKPAHGKQTEIRLKGRRCFVFKPQERVWLMQLAWGPEILKGQITLAAFRRLSREQLLAETRLGASSWGHAHPSSKVSSRWFWYAPVLARAHSATAGRPRPRAQQGAAMRASRAAAVGLPWPQRHADAPCPAAPRRRLGGRAGAAIS